MLPSTIPGWVDTSSKIELISEKNLTFRIFEMIVLGLQPWSIVSDPGLLRHHAVFTPNFDIGREKYYCSMFNPAYEKIKLAIKKYYRSTTW